MHSIHPHHISGFFLTVFNTGNFKSLSAIAKNLIQRIKEAALKLFNAFRCGRHPSGQNGWICSYPIADLSFENQCVLLNGRIWHITSRNLTNWQEQDIIQICQDEHRDKGLYLLKNTRIRNSYYAFTKNKQDPQIAGTCVRLIKTVWTGYIEHIDRKQNILYIQPDYHPSAEALRIKEGLIPDTWARQDKTSLQYTGKKYWLRNLYRSEDLKLT